MNSKTSVRKNSKTIYSYEVHYRAGVGGEDFVREYEGEDYEDVVKHFRHDIAWAIFSHRRDHIDPYWTLHKFQPVRFACFARCDIDCKVATFTDFYNSGWSDDEWWEHPSFGHRVVRLG